MAPCYDVDVLRAAFLEGKANFRKFLLRNGPADSLFGNLVILAERTTQVAA